MDCSKGKGNPSLWRNAGRGTRLSKPAASILSKTAGARGETCNLFNGLIAWPAQTGEDRFLLLAAFAASSRVGSNLDNPCLAAREGRLFKCVLPGASDGPDVS